MATVSSPYKELSNEATYLRDKKHELAQNLRETVSRLGVSGEEMTTCDRCVAAFVPECLWGLFANSELITRRSEDFENRDFYQQELTANEEAITRHISKIRNTIIAEEIPKNDAFKEIVTLREHWDPILTSCGEIARALSQIDSHSSWRSDLSPESKMDRL